MKATVLLLALALTGCTFCQGHTKTCAAVTIVAAGSLAAAFDAHRSEGRSLDAHISDPSCQSRPESCR